MRKTSLLYGLQPRNWGLVTRLITATALLSVLSIAGVTFIINTFTHRQMRNLVSDQLIIVSELQGERIGHVFAGQVDLLHSNIATEPTVIAALLEKNNTYAQSSKEIEAELLELDALWQSDEQSEQQMILVTNILENSISDRLHIYQKNFPANAEVFITDRYGAIIASTNKTSDYYQADETWWQSCWNAGIGLITVNPPQFDESSNVLSIEIAIPVYDPTTGNVIGIIKTIYDISAIIEEVRSFRLGETGYSRVVDGNNLFITHDNQSYVGSPIPEGWLSYIHEFSNSSTFLDTYDKDGAKVVLGYAPVTTNGKILSIDNLGWKVFVEQEHSEAFLLITQLQSSIVSSAVIAIVTAIALAFVVGRSLTQDLIHLTSVAHRLARGERDIRATVNREDEIGRLADSFNIMTDQLIQTINRLDEQVQKTEQVNTLLSAQNTYLTGLKQIIENLLNQTQSDHLIQSIVNSAAAFLEASYAEILFVDGDNLVIKASTRNQLTLSDNRVTRQEDSLVWQVYDTQKAISFDDRSSWQADRENPRSMSFNAAAAFPIMIGKKCQGVLSVGRTTPNAVFLQQQLDYGSQLTDLVALLLHQVNLHEAAIEEIKQRRQAEIALRESEARFRSYFELNLIGIAITSIDRNWLEVNSKACEILGYSREELLQMQWSDITHPEDLDSNNLLLQRLLSGEVDYYALEKRYIHKTGKSIYCKVNISAVYDANDSVKYLITALEDITKIKEGEQAKLEHEHLANLLRAEQEWNAIVQRTMKVFSHELRIPLSVIQTSGTLLTRYSEKLSEERRLEKLNLIEDQVQRIQDILNDVADIVQNSLRTETFKPDTMDLNRFCYVMTEELKYTIGSHHQITSVVSEDAQTVYADAKLLTRILMNLLGNAIKYSPMGSEIRLEAQREEGNVIISVADQGMGISEEHLNHIFEPFYRTDTVEDIQGTGLGLNIVADCVRLHQGTISVESKLDIGTTFKVVLPQPVYESNAISPEL